MSKWFSFSVLYELGYKCAFTFAREIRQIQSTCLNDACPMHWALRASGIGRIKIQCACIEFVLCKIKCAFINLNNTLMDTAWLDVLTSVFINNLRYRVVQS